VNLKQIPEEYRARTLKAALVFYTTNPNQKIKKKLYL
jgi:hypothetical protein